MKWLLILIVAHSCSSEVEKTTLGTFPTKESCQEQRDKFSTGQNVMLLCEESK